MSNWYTADTHFGSDSKEVLVRDNRPFKDINEYTKEQVRIWNEQASGTNRHLRMTPYTSSEISVTAFLSLKTISGAVLPYQSR